MNKLEEAIQKALQSYPMTHKEVDNWDTDGLSEAAAKACMPFIEKAWDAATERAEYPWRPTKNKKEWLKENIGG